MKFLHWFFNSNKNKSGSEKESTKIINGTPINKSLGFLTHTSFVESEFNFLINDFGFEIIKNEWISRDYITIFEKKPIQVKINYEYGSLPFIEVKNTNLINDESKKLYDAEIVDDFDSSIRDIRNQYNARRESIRNSTSQKRKKEDVLSLNELDQDYKINGNQEHINLLIAAAITVRNILENKLGVE